jgi:hypothetical protein
VDRAIDALVRDSTVPPPELRGPIAEILETRRRDAVIEGDYDRAEEQDHIAQWLQLAVQNAEQKESEDRTINRLYDRWQQLQNQQQEISSCWDNRLRELEERYEQQQVELQEAQANEVAAFVARWKNPEFLRPYTKASPMLLQLRDQERSMGLARMYAQAKEMKAIADRAQREETLSAQARIHVQMTAERQKLGARHERALKELALKKDQAAKAARERRQKELRPVLAAIAQMKAKKGLAKGPGSASETASNAGHENLCSPRTAARYSAFRAEKKAVILEVAPADDRVVSAKRTPRPKSAVTPRARP